MDAKEVLEMIEKDNPGKRFAINKTGCGIGVWNEKMGRYQTCIGKLLTGRWVYMPMEVLVNGKPVDEYA